MTCAILWRFIDFGVVLRGHNLALPKPIRPTFLSAIPLSWFLTSECQTGRHLCLHKKLCCGNNESVSFQSLLRFWQEIFCQIKHILANGRSEAFGLRLQGLAANSSPFTEPINFRLPDRNMVRSDS